MGMMGIPVKWEKELLTSEKVGWWEMTLVVILTDSLPSQPFFPLSRHGSLFVIVMTLIVESIDVPFPGVARSGGKKPGDRRGCGEKTGLVKFIHSN